MNEIKEGEKWNGIEGIWTRVCPVSPEGLLWKNLNFEFKSIFFSKNLASPERPEKKYYDGAYELTLYFSALRFLKCVFSHMLSYFKVNEFTQQIYIKAVHTVILEYFNVKE